MFGRSKEKPKTFKVNVTIKDNREVLFENVSNSYVGSNGVLVIEVSDGCSFTFNREEWKGTASMPVVKD